MHYRWFDQQDTRNRFARVLWESDLLNSGEDILDFYEKPYKWDEEFLIWLSYGSPDSESLAWDDFLAKVQSLSNPPPLDE